LEDVLEGDGAQLGEAQVPREIAQETATVPKVVRTKRGRIPKTRAEAVTDMAPGKESTQGEVEGVDKAVEIDEDNEVTDPDTMFEAQCILKQRQRKGGWRQFLVNCTAV